CEGTGCDADVVLDPENLVAEAVATASCEGSDRFLRLSLPIFEPVAASPAACVEWGAWQQEVAAHEVGGGLHGMFGGPRAARDSTGGLHVVFVWAGPEDEMELRYLGRDPEDGAWLGEVVSPQYGVTSPVSPALALDAAGVPHVMHRGFLDPSQGLVVHSWRGPDGWDAETIAPIAAASSDAFEHQVSLAAEPDGTLRSLFGGDGLSEAYCPDSRLKEACLACPDVFCVFQGTRRPGEDWEFVASDLSFLGQNPSDPSVLELVPGSLNGSSLAGFATSYSAEIWSPGIGEFKPVLAGAFLPIGYPAGLSAGAVAAIPGAGAAVLVVRSAPFVLVRSAEGAAAVVGVPHGEAGLGFGGGEGQNLAFDALGRPHIAQVGDGLVGHLRLHGGGDTDGWIVDTLPAEPGTRWSAGHAPAILMDPTGRLHWIAGRTVAGEEGKPETDAGEIVHLWRDCVKTL
ncbi:MAG: hypothetical protein FJ087_06020, partial [Deltaproteobacteria bacterium]|nr:hypothetical protein [Deltaproteobacteria bacterium]